MKLIAPFDLTRGQQRPMAGARRTRDCFVSAEEVRSSDWVLPKGSFCIQWLRWSVTESNCCQTNASNRIENEEESKRCLRGFSSSFLLFWPMRSFWFYLAEMLLSNVSISESMMLQGLLKVTRFTFITHEFQLKDKSLMLMLCTFTSHNHLFEVWSVEGNAKYYCIEDDSDNAEIQYCLDLTRLTPPTCIWNLCWLYFAFILKYFSGLCMWEFTDITRTWKFIECLPAESHVFSFCVKYALSICCVLFECQHVQNFNTDEAKNDQRLSKTTKTNSTMKKD